MIRTKSNKLRLFLKHITDVLNIGSKETWYTLLQIHHIDLLKEGNDWDYFGPNISIKKTADWSILWPESDDTAWLVVAMSPPKLHHLREIVPFNSVDSAVQSTLHTGKWCAINLVTANTEYVHPVLTVWIYSVWLLGLFFLHKNSWLTGNDFPVTVQLPFKVFLQNSFHHKTEI